mgnify:CR=1 FL=1
MVNDVFFCLGREGDGWGGSTDEKHVVGRMWMMRLGGRKTRKAEKLYVYCIENKKMFFRTTNTIDFIVFTDVHFKIYHCVGVDFLVEHA